MQNAAEFDVYVCTLHVEDFILPLNSVLVHFSLPAELGVGLLKFFERRLELLVEFVPAQTLLLHRAQLTSQELE